MTRGFRTELAPTKEQAATFRRWCGTSRFVYNWGLARRIEHFEATGKTLSWFDQCAEVRDLKAQPETLWLKEPPSLLLNAALQDLERAYQHFFRRVKAGTEKPGFPKFKARGRSRDSFRVLGGIRCRERGVKIPKMGWVRVKEEGYLPSPADLEKLTMPGDPEKHARIISATVSRRADRWFVSVAVEMPDPPAQSGLSGTLALHPGVRVLLTARYENGEAADSEAHREKLRIEKARREKVRREKEKTLARVLRRLRREERKMARHEKGGVNWRRTRRRVRTLYAHATKIHQELEIFGSEAIGEESPEVRYENPQALARVLKRLRRAQRQMARREKGGANWRKTLLRVQKLYARATDIRRDAIHKATTDAIRRFRPAVVVVQAWDVKGMMESEEEDLPRSVRRRRRRTLADAATAEIRRQIEYKATATGAHVALVPGAEPVSRRCSGCGVVIPELPLSRVRWTCAACGAEHERETNACKNLIAVATELVFA